MKIGKILVPMDGSANAFRGLNAAISIAVPSGASIVLIHAMYEPAHSEFNRAGPISKARKDDVRRFMARAEALLKRRGVPYRSKIVYGNTGYSILRAAHSKSEKFDMIVIGSRGRGSIKEMFFGSTSNYVIHSSKIPVLVIK